MVADAAAHVAMPYCDEKSWMFSTDTAFGNQKEDYSIVCQIM